ncbi:GNAT family N-acetyltransferase [Neorhizobium alkalisoli]|uniref:Putative N-acetyltransferase YhbS n=1 Tax=Neorhizobium alkalisoli TaxID=528178 RepID=A0A561QJ55_9HYPH|nr:GNAT family N-acetyltransferase [Neorhizobium alkalisoli]TWF50398.1 putative N-acetyltransferase YhbS [Neorhizobium alkalisoli]
MIRPAVEADESDIRTCAESAYTRYIEAIGKRPAPMDADFAAQIEAGEVHVSAADDGAFQGFIVFFPENGRMFLENVAVMPSAAGKGVGKSLIGFCEDEARRLGLAAVELYTNEKMIENLSIYPRLGYVETGRRTENGFNRVFFEKTLEQP